MNGIRSRRQAPEDRRERMRLDPVIAKSAETRAVTNSNEVTRARRVKRNDRARNKAARASRRRNR
jgi:hypothetical protein